LIARQANRLARRNPRYTAGERFATAIILGMPNHKARQAQQKTASDLLFAAELDRQGLHQAAEQHLLKILETQPKEWRALHQLGDMCLARGDHVQALSFIAAAMKANPGSADAKSNYGFILQKLERHEEALVYFNQALVVQPSNISALLNRGTSLHRLNRPDAALSSFDRVLALDPRNAKAHYNRANILHEQRRFDECLAAFAKAVALAPDYADAHFNEALTRLLLGDFEQGWKKYEWRWKTESQRHLSRDFGRPLWLGAESLAGKTILIHFEQGLGDSLQFARYLPRLAAMGAEVVIEVPPSLQPLLSRVPGVSRVIGREDQPPPFDVHCPIMSLPLAFNSSLEAIPADVPYLEVPPDHLSKWQSRLPPKRGLRVVVAWAGSATHKHDLRRSIPLAALQPLFDAGQGIEWLAVQRDLREDDEACLAELPRVLQLGAKFEDFADTAAVLSLADLVITVDTAIAHLAGALARPVWILLQHSPDFRWLLDRDDSPWYPTARLFRQERSGDWDETIARVAAALRQQPQSN
jgi:tetratricopeptide (TPR) repeat protein